MPGGADTTAGRRNSRWGAHRRAWSRRLLRHLPLVVLALGVGGQGALLLSRVGQGWFGVDALHYLAQRGAVTTPTESLMEPYAGHWQPLLVLGYRTLYEFFALDTYLPYVLPGVLVHLGLCLVLYAICVRVGANRWAAALVAVALAWFGAGSEAFLADAPVALTSTVLVAYGCAFLVVREPWTRRSLVLVGIALVCALMVSNAAVTATMFVGLVVLARRGWRPAAILVGVPAAVYLVWFAAVGRSGERGRVGASDLLLLPERAAALLVAPFESITSGGLGSAVLIAVLVGPFLAARVSPRLRSLAWAGMVAALVQALLCSAANVALGPDAVVVGRYQYVVLAYLTPAIITTLTLVVDVARPAAGRFTADVRSGLAPAAVVAVIGAMVIVNGLQAENATWRLTQAEARKAETLTKGGVASIALGERMLEPDGGGFTVHGDDIQTLGDVGGASWESLQATAEQRIAAEALLFSAAGPETFYVQAPAGLTSTSFDKPLRERFGCQTVMATELAPEITMTTFQGAQIAVESASSAVTVELSRDDELADPVVWQLTPGETSYLATTAQLAEVRMTFNAGGAYVICRS